MKWIDIKGFEGWFKLNEQGQVLSLERTIACKNRSPFKVKEKVLKNILKNNGYYNICLSKNGVFTYRTIHSLVAEHFIPNPHNYPCINHKDGNKLNNSIDNLEWCTYSENNRHAIANKLNTIPHKQGSACHNSTMTTEEVLELKREHLPVRKIPLKELAKKYNTNESTICSILKGRSYTSVVI